MKKYRISMSMFSSKKMPFLALLFTVISIMIYLLTDSINQYIIIFNGISLSIILCCLLNIFANGLRYSFRKSFISFSLFGIVYKKVNYEKFAYIVISNACYNNEYGSISVTEIPIRYKSKGSNGTIYTVYPFITLHNKNYPVKIIKSDMSSREIYRVDTDNSFCLGICWFDSLTDLLIHSNYPIYLLEDVYLRFKGSFDSVFIQTNFDLNKINIVGRQGTVSVKTLMNTGDGSEKI